MKTEVYQPTAILAPFIKEYRIIESEAAIVNRVLPNTSLSLVFRFKGQVSYLQDRLPNILPTTAISGLRKSVRLISYAPNTINLIVIFKETGAAALFKEPMHELFEKSISLDSFTTVNEVAKIATQLTATDNNKARIAIFEQFLFSKVINFKADTLITIAIERIQNANGILRIKQLATELHISQDAFEKRFRKVVGASPKQFAYITRMNALIRNPQKKGSLFDMAFDAGFYDQSHFNKDFKLFTGLTPTDFYKSNLFW